LFEAKGSISWHWNGKKIAFESGQCLISDVEGKVTEVDANHISIKTKR